MNLVSPSQRSAVEWVGGSLFNRVQQPLTWYKVRDTQGNCNKSLNLLQPYNNLRELQAYFDAPEGNEPLALDLRSMGKGQAWINGQSIGRYWMEYANGNCGVCKYAGTYRAPKCQQGCGQPTQRW